MPWQAHFYIGERVATVANVKDIMTELGGILPALIYPDHDWHGHDFNVPSHDIVYSDKVYSIRPEFITKTKSEGGVSFPLPEDEVTGQNDYTDAIVGFAMTSRYSGSILDADCKGGRPEPLPFYIDITGAADILRQTRVWWPRAELMIWLG